MYPPPGPHWKPGDAVIAGADVELDYISKAGKRAPQERLHDCRVYRVDHRHICRLALAEQCAAHLIEVGPATRANALQRVLHPTSFAAMLHATGPVAAAPWLGLPLVPAYLPDELHDPPIVFQADGVGDAVVGREDVPAVLHDDRQHAADVVFVLLGIAPAPDVEPAM